MSIVSNVIRLIDASTPCIWVLVAETKGSVPREAGASMVVTATKTMGTIGGGHLELKAIEHARAMLAQHADVATQRHYPLGPALGQCCGGAVGLLFAPIDASHRETLAHIESIATNGGTFDFNRIVDTCETVSIALRFEPWHVWIFGAGHVGKALVDVLATLPCRVSWVDGREAEFPSVIPSNVQILLCDSPANEVARIPAQAQVLILTHSHAIDLEICFALLKRDDLAYCGLIGSATKAATFRKRFAQRGLTEAAISRIICPIGKHHLQSKHPGVIAVGVAMDLIEKQQQHLAKEAELLGPCA
jgi:xanthine dehydrogenase accessory factor